MVALSDMFTSNRKPIVTRESNEIRTAPAVASEPHNGEMRQLRQRLLQMILSTEARRRTSVCHA